MASITYTPNTNTPPRFRLTGIDASFITALKVYGEYGNLVYEYNPLRNLRLKYDLYQQDNLGRLIDSQRNPISFTYNGKVVVLTLNNIYNLIETNAFGLTDLQLTNSDTITEALQARGLSLVVIARSGTLVDFETNNLKFSLNNPVLIECQPSYDGSVNLIINDDLNLPRLINSRFTPLENNTYKVANRKGNNDTNIYDQDSFDIDTSLYKRITTIPDLEFIGLKSGGNMKVGNYNFYFKYADADGNETDFVIESGNVVCYVGNVNSPMSIRGGLRDESSNKMVHFFLTDIDSSYDYVTVYFTRNTSDADGTPVISAGKIDKNFTVTNRNTCDIIITGFEPIEDKTIEDINVQYNIVDAAKAQAQALNMLFMGNVYKPEIPYEELQDLSLRFYPTAYIDKSNPIGYVDNTYTDSLNQEYEYYNPLNIYNKLSYWDNEIYRFGIVYILNDYTLSPVFDIRGRNNLRICQNESAFNADFYTLFPVYSDDINPVTGEKTRNYIEINEDYSVGAHDLENAKGVIRITLDDTDDYIINRDSVTPLGIKFYVPSDVITELSKYCKGYFIVRLKRIPTILAQAITIGLDKNAYVPLLPIAGESVDPVYMTERFVNDDLVLDHYFDNHKYLLTGNKVEIKAALCPEAELRYPLLNQLFTGSEFNISESKLLPNSNRFFTDYTLEGRNFYIPEYTTVNTSAGEIIENVKVTMVEDDIKIKTSGTLKYAARAGEAEEAWRLGYLYKDENSNKAANIIRGSWGLYLGIENYTVPMRIINIHIPGYSLSLLNEYFDIRYNDVSPYFPIMHRTSLELFSEDFVTINESNGKPNKYLTTRKYGGDCYVSNFTHRMMRNFQDPETPVNDLIVEPNTFKNNFSIDNEDDNKNINRGDVNAVKLGHWVTIKILSNFNLNLRDLDYRWFTEEGLTGKPRNFFPLYGRSIDGDDKVPESQLINGGISSSTSEKYNYILPNVPYIKNEFDTRIMYSDVHINDAFKNGYRVFKSTNFRDYTKEFGAITKLISWFGNIVCVFEHGVALIPVNERAIAGEGPGGSVFINTSNVLPENPKIVSPNFGSGWVDSIITSDDFIYGVDTVAKKIWRTNGEQFEVISDFKIQKFLNDFITLRERELTPTIGVRNVKTHYNAFKKDIMFTFYDDLYGFEENVWNVCFNEMLNKWITFYSWLPSDSENIDNIFFSFDRNTSKWISKLGKTNATSTYADGICLDNVIFMGTGIDPNEATNFIGNVTLENRNVPIIEGKTNVAMKFELLEDNFGNHLSFNLVDSYDNNFLVGFNADGSERLQRVQTGAKLYYTGNYNDYIYDEAKNNKKVYLLNLKVTFTYYIFKNADNSAKQFTELFTTYTTVNGGYFENSIAVAPYENILILTTDFWKHGQAGIIDIKDEIKPTKWYGKIHPFEFEFIVADNPFVLKIFTNLYIISNKAEPESFHFEVVGEGYSFDYDKENMFYRQELTKEMFQQSMYRDILYNRDYRTLATPRLNNKSAFLPLYYERVSTFDEIYDFYQLMTSNGRDYQNLSGGEIVWDKLLNEFKVMGHQKGNDIRKVGRLRGNMMYKEDVWNVEIRPLNFVEKNETILFPKTEPIPIIVSRIPNYDIINPATGKPYDNPNQYPIGSPSSPIPAQQIPFATGYDGHKVFLYDAGTIPTGFNPAYLSKWSSRRETRLRDKFIRIKIRYSGNDLAVISALKTIYTNSYA